LIGRGASKTGAMTSAFLDTIAHAQGPGKCLPSDYVYADFAEGTPYVPDTSAGTSFQPKATPLAFSRLNLIVCSVKRCFVVSKATSSVDEDQTQRNNRKRCEGDF
jgi:hypothetical protein